VTVALKNLTFNGDFSSGKKPEVAGSHIWAVGVLTDLGDAMFCPPPPKKKTKAFTKGVERAGAVMPIR